MKENSQLYKDLIAKIYYFSSYKSLADVGGGACALLVSLLLRHPHLQGINFDMPAQEGPVNILGCAISNIWPLEDALYLIEVNVLPDAKGIN